MTLLTSLIPFVQFTMAGRLLLGYSVALGLLGAASSLVGQLVLVGYVRRTGRSSLIALAIAIISISAALLLCITGALSIKSDAEAGRTFGFRSLC
jgi:uncharacterized membrane protein